MYRVFNMSIGYVLVVAPSKADEIVHVLKEAGEQVYTLGKIVEGTGKVVLR